MFIDVVSKNGTFLLNFPLLPDGTLDAKEEGILEEITRWIAINGDAIYFTRPWKKFGESPTALPAGSSKDGKPHTFCLGWPEGAVNIASLGPAAGLWNNKIAHIRLLGSEEKLTWAVEPERVRIERPRHQPSDLAIAFEISAE